MIKYQVPRSPPLSPQAQPSLISTDVDYDSRLLKVDGNRHYVFAPRPGIFEPTFSLGDAVVAGQVAGSLFDPHAPWQPPIELAFQGEGLVVCARTFAGVEPGDRIAVLATDTAWS